MMGLYVNQMGGMNLMFAFPNPEDRQKEYIISDVGAIGTLDSELYAIKGEVKLVVNFGV